MLNANSLTELPNSFYKNVPFPYRVIGDALYRVETKQKGNQADEGKMLVARHAPIIMRGLYNVEQPHVYYEIAWIDRGKLVVEIVEAGAIATKKEMMPLAKKGFPCNDNNYRQLIDYFEKMLAFNQIDRGYMAERLGHIKNGFAHPLLPRNYEILPTDHGEKQLLEAFQVSGTVQGWITNVFEPIKHHPRALFMVVSSFASVLLNDLKIDPFIVDLAGTTSLGKTTALRTSASVWGTRHLVNELNATKVSIERKAAFLNSFPLIMDDSMKVDERGLVQSIIYNFSGGRSKGRGTLKGSQKELTWGNIMLTSGEFSLSEYAQKAGGAAARIISLNGSPFDQVNENFFNELYKGLECHYGAVGLKFVEEYLLRKKDILPSFQQVKDYYQNKSKNNAVLSRVALYYSTVHFTAIILGELLHLDINIELFEQLFDEMVEENKEIDKPKQLLEEILLKLDSSRKDIFYSYHPNNMKAVYKFDTICLTPAFLKDFLGPQEKLIRSEWVKRNFTITTCRDGKWVDYQTIKHQGKTFKVICINKKIIEEFGLDFSEELI